MSRLPAHGWWYELDAEIIHSINDESTAEKRNEPDRALCGHLPPHTDSSGVGLLPQLAAILGYGLWLGDLQEYYYLSLMPAAVLTVLLGATALVPARIAHLAGIALLVAAVAIVPARLRYAATLRGCPPTASSLTRRARS